MLFGYTLETIYNVAICPRGYLQADLLNKLPEVTLKYQSSPEVILFLRLLSLVTGFEEFVFTL